jgi:predicted esterase
MMATMQNPHAGQPVLRFGPPPSEARATVVLVHGRGDSASGILGLAHELNLADVAFLAPQAAGNTWYPYSFLTPMEKNEPHLSSALSLLAGVIETLDGEHGVSAERIVVMGFSQGACLSLEFAARHARRYGGIVALSGGLIGPPGTPRNYPGSFGGTPAFLGCSDIDAHIPVERVRESAEVYRKMGAQVDERIYPGMGHTINEDELTAVRSLLSGVRAPDSTPTP